MSDIVDGWGRGTWGEGAWNENIPVQISNPNDVPWGSLGWSDGVFGGSNNLTLNLNSVTVGIGATVILTGEELIHVLESNIGVSAGGSVQVPAFENPLITNLNSVNVAIFQDAFASATGQDLTLTLGDENVTANANIDLIGQSLTLVLGDENVFTDVVVSLNTQNLTTTLGNVDPSPDAIVTGQQATLTLNSVTVLGTANVSLTGQNLTSVLGNETAFTNVNVNVTGQSLIGTTGQLYVTAWAPVDTGSTVSYSGVNTGQTITWTDVAA